MIERLKEVFTEDERVRFLPNNEALMWKINEIIEAVNKLEERVNPPIPVISVSQMMEIMKRNASREP